MTLGALNTLFDILMIFALPLSFVSLIRFLRAWMDRDRKQIYFWACILLALVLFFYFNLYFTLLQLHIGDQPFF